MTSSSSCLTTPSPQPIGMPPVTPDSQFTSASPTSLSESFDHPNDILCLSSDEEDPTVPFQGDETASITSDTEHITDSQSSPIAQHFQ